MKNREHLSLHITRTALLVIFISLAIIYIPTLTTAAQPTSPGMNAPNAQTSPTCYKPLSVTSDISGYAEGYISFKNPYMQGQEVVYDLATFQRRQFGDKMSVGKAPQNTGKYVETISGFITNQGDPTIGLCVAIVCRTRSPLPEVQLSKRTANVASVDDLLSNILYRYSTRQKGLDRDFVIIPIQNEKQENRRRSGGKGEICLGFVAKKMLTYL